MLRCMKTREITDWVTSLDDVHALVRATHGAKSRADADGMLGEALAAIEALHGRMLRAEVRSVFAKAASSER
jgi:hypothetical protein